MVFSPAGDGVTHDAAQRESKTGRRADLDRNLIGGAAEEQRRERTSRVGLTFLQARG